MDREKDRWAELERWIREGIWEGETTEEQTRNCVEVVKEWIAREVEEEGERKHRMLWH